MSKVVNIVLIILGIVLIAGQGYLFYFASCETVKDYWMLTHVPGRCINP